MQATSSTSPQLPHPPQPVSSCFRPLLFFGRVALVTGGGTGIGLRVAKELTQLGAITVLASRKQDAIDAAVREVNALYPPQAFVDGSSSATSSTATTTSPSLRPRCYGHTLNVRSPSSISDLLTWISSNNIGEHPSGGGRIDMLVHAAGGQFPSPAANISHKGWQAVVQTNLDGTFFMNQAVYEHFFSKQVPTKEQLNAIAAPASSSSQPSLPRAPPACGGVIVNVVADVHNGFPLFSHTSAARAGVINLTKTLAIEWASAGVRVNAVAPGVIASSGLGRYDPAMQATIAERAAHNNYAYRLGTEAECAAAILFLLSPAASYITGICLNVDAGESLYSPIMPPSPHRLRPSWDDSIDQQRAPDFLKQKGKLKTNKATTSMQSKL